MYRSINRRTWLAGALLCCGMAGCGQRHADPVTPTAGNIAAGATGSAGESATTGASAPAGERIYDGNCVACHQQDARGVPGVYPSLVGSPLLLGDPQTLAGWVIEGRRPASLPPGRYSTAMPRFGWLKAADAAALFTYLRSHFGNSAGAVDAATVARAVDSP